MSESKTIENSRKQRLRNCENVLVEHMEEFVRVGLALQEIRDDRLYKEDGIETWDAYLKANKERFGFGSRTYAHNVIESAELRKSLGDVFSIENIEVNEFQIRELRRLGSPSKAKHVAKQIVKGLGDADLTAALVRKYVNEQLGIIQGSSVNRPKPKFEDVILRWTDELGTMADQIKSVPADALGLFARNHKAKARALAAAIERLEKSLTRVWESLP